MPVLVGYDDGIPGARDAKESGNETPVQLWGSFAEMKFVGRIDERLDMW